MAENKLALIVFQKNPVLGKVKTRLAATIGDHQALDVYLQLLQHTYKMINELNGIDTYIYFSDYLENKLDEIFVDDVHFRVQNGLDLGSKMKNAFEEMFVKGYDKALIIGTDCPEISSALINKAYIELGAANVVFGPALDGGYYLLGMNQPTPILFDNMTWSHSKVMDDSIERLQQKNLSFSLLDELSDIDNERDWERFKNLTSQTL
ncbi:TIGR04282 family arsenosugar biosynthesis glycosyltransferase [Belliella sp. R4-6]|uniref:TIGR04282 family arsenosugar biosynthesis glycosyltransferase n=1 Tax=Belliella alkalica TaxID=1730871 RepID=A0ABS9V683_9BACT|nr:TIGR04282 family arsenosugar biosynthesis glycosyltransferase [Belliella alkalica]MCH7411934.1 TIGR04282 family arsenosugar biosynthesis glycosyltransferase [Belliella alkalica]